MKTVIVGCGRVGSVLADAFDRAGHQVIVARHEDDRLRPPARHRSAAPPSAATAPTRTPSAGPAPRRADLFMAMTEGDNRNVMSAQLATEALGARQVIAKINDPLRASAYAELGIATLCRTNLMASAVSEFLGLGLTFGPGLSAATGQHPGGEHHGAGDDGAGAAPDRPARRPASPASAADGPAGASPRPSFAAAPAGAAPADTDSGAGRAGQRPGGLIPCSCSSSAAERSATT